MRLRSLPTMTAAAMVAALALLAPSPSRADLIVTFRSVTVAANSTGNTTDVILTNSGPAAVTVGGFSFQIRATAAGINFTAATIDTTSAPYIFNGHSLFGPTINTTSGATLIASDDYDVAGSGVMVAAGATVGLGHVSFNVGTESGSVTFGPYPATSLADASGNNIPITTLIGGTITVTSVPEPSSLAGLLSALPAAAWLTRRSRRS